MAGVTKQHHHNSVRFNCQCGRLWTWSREDIQVVALIEGTYYVWCPCGITHYKDQTNFRGESKLLKAESTPTTEEESV